MAYHEHSSLEISYVVSGVLDFYYFNRLTEKEEKRSVSENQVLITLPKIRHKTDIPFNLSCVGVEFVSENGIIEDIKTDPFFAPFLAENHFVFENGFAVIGGTPRILSLLKEAEQYFGKESESPITRRKVELLFKNLFLQAWEASNVKAATPEENSFFKKADLYIQENYHKDLRVKDVVAITRASQSYLQAVFLKKTGNGIKHRIDQVRIDRAASMLKETNYSIGQIAKIVGFKNATSFLSNFKKYKGMLPKEYREVALKAQAKRHFKESGAYSEIVYR